MNLREWWRFRRQHSIFGDRCKLCRAPMNYRGIGLVVRQRRVVYACGTCAARIHEILSDMRHFTVMDPAAMTRYEKGIEH